MSGLRMNVHGIVWRTNLFVGLGRGSMWVVVVCVGSCGSMCLMSQMLCGLVGPGGRWKIQQKVLLGRGGAVSNVRHTAESRSHEHSGDLSSESPECSRDGGGQTCLQVLEENESNREPTPPR